MTQLDDLKAYLSSVTPSGTYDDATLTRVLSVETAAQAAVLKTGIVITTRPDLLEALFRRVARNLEMRSIPLAISDSPDASVRVGGRDPEVRRLEAPFRRLVVG